MGFTRRLVLVYTCILVIPLFGAVLFGTSWYHQRSYDNLFNTSSTQVKYYSDNILHALETFISVETAINSDDDFAITLMRPETVSDPVLVDTIVDEASFLSSLSIVLDDLYDIRVFADNDGIPERWPYILHSSRDDLLSLPKYSYSYVADYLGNQLALQVESMCYTKRITHRNHPVGFLQVAIKMEDMFPQLYKNQHATDKNNELITFDYIYKTDADGFLTESVTASGKSSIFPDLAPEYIQQINAALNQTNAVTGSQRIHVGRKSMILCWEKIPRMNLVVLQLNSTEPIDSNVLLFRIAVFFALTLVIIMFSMVIRYVTSRMLDRVYNVMDGLRQVSNGKMDVTLTVDGHDEVAETQRAFNFMTEQLRSQIETIKEEQSLLADTEIKAMQNQINAHFLYNVLETIKMQAVLKDQDDISESLTVLGKMMRYCLRWRIHRVTVQQEIDYICSYVYILNLRNDYLITLNLEIPPECEGIEIPKMVLQPVIENAFTYAIEPMAQDSEVTVSARLEEDRLWLCVRDYGDGMTAEKLAGIRSYLADKTYERDTTKGSIGLKNIQQRLYMFYGDSYSIQIESQAGWGTEIRIPVPAVKGV